MSEIEQVLAEQLVQMAEAVETLTVRLNELCGRVDSLFSSAESAPSGQPSAGPAQLWSSWLTAHLGRQQRLPSVPDGGDTVSQLRVLATELVPACYRCQAAMLRVLPDGSYDVWCSLMHRDLEALPGACMGRSPKGPPTERLVVERALQAHFSASRQGKPVQPLGQYLVAVLDGDG